jgi:hypothetical protein
MGGRERRLAENEALFRDVNEQIQQAAGRFEVGDDHVYEFLCECSNRDCTKKLALTRGRYERARSQPTWFIVARGHELPDIERVVADFGDYRLVEKQDEAAEIVAERDPRT